MPTALTTTSAAALLTEVQHALAYALLRHPDTDEGRAAAWSELGWTGVDPAVRDAISAEVLAALVPDPTDALMAEHAATDEGLAALAAALRRHPNTPEGRSAAWAETELIADGEAERDAISEEVLAEY